MELKLLWERDGTGDVYYSLELAEYVFTVKQDSNLMVTQNNIRPAKPNIVPNQ